MGDGPNAIAKRDNLVVAAGLVAVGALSAASATIWLVLTSPRVIFDLLFRLMR